MDIVFTIKTLQIQWSCDTMNRRYKSIDRNQYDQLFTNNTYFAKVHPMDSNRKAGDDLKILYQYFGVLEKLTFDGYKEQACKGTKFGK